MVKHLKLDSLNEALEAQPADTIVTPKRFMHNVNRACEREPQHIVLPEGMEPRVLRAAAGVARKGLAKITILGEPEAIQAEGKRLSLDLSQVRLSSMSSSQHLGIVAITDQAFPSGIKRYTCDETNNSACRNSHGSVSEWSDEPQHCYEQR